jgi:hypothetical protein
LENEDDRESAVDSGSAAAFAVDLDLLVLRFRKLYKSPTLTFDHAAKDEKGDDHSRNASECLESTANVIEHITTAAGNEK